MKKKEAQLVLIQKGTQRFVCFVLYYGCLGSTNAWTKTIQRSQTQASRFVVDGCVVLSRSHFQNIRRNAGASPNNHGNSSWIHTVVHYSEKYYKAKEYYELTHILS